MRTIRPQHCTVPQSQMRDTVEGETGTSASNELDFYQADGNLQGTNLEEIQLTKNHHHEADDDDDLDFDEFDMEIERQPLFSKHKRNDHPRNSCGPYQQRSLLGGISQEATTSNNLTDKQHLSLNISKIVGAAHKRKEESDRLSSFSISS